MGKVVELTRTGAICMLHSVKGFLRNHIAALLKLEIQLQLHVQLKLASISFTSLPKQQLKPCKWTSSDTIMYIYKYVNRQLQIQLQLQAHPSCKRKGCATRQPQCPQIWTTRI